MSTLDLPAINAILNGTATLLLATGRWFIHRQRIAAHRACMISAFAISIAFLGSYLTYHYHHGSTVFPGTGWARTSYLVMLVSHILLAITVVPLAAVTLWRGLTRQDERHRRIARITFPIWMYVSVTGVLIYVILYQVYGVTPR